MQPYPHHYYASAVGEPSDPTTVSSPGLVDLETHTTPEFDGPPGYWSPETMLVAAAANCFILTFRSVAAHSKFDWIDLQVDAEGVLDKVDRAAKFTKLNLLVRLILPAGADQSKAERLLAMADRLCLVSNSLNCEVTLTSELAEG